MTTQGSTDGWVRAYRLAALGEDEPVHVGHRPVPGYACSALAAAKLPPEVWSGHEHFTVLGAGRRAAARPG